MTSATTQFGSLELKVLGLIQDVSVSVSEVQASLRKGGDDLAYTTVMTVLVRLHDKGVLKRHKSGRQYLYSSSKQTSSSRQGVFTRIHKTLFGSERLKPILTFLENDKTLTRDELEELERVVKAKLRGKDHRR